MTFTQMTTDGGAKLNLDLATAAMRFADALQHMKEKVGDVSMLDLNVYLYVCKHAPEAVTQADIVSHFSEPKETVRRSLERLEKVNGGLIIRRGGGDDRRVNDVLLSPLGRTLGKRLAAILARDEPMED